MCDSDHWYNKFMFLCDEELPVGREECTCVMESFLLGGRNARLRRRLLILFRGKAYRWVDKKPSSPTVGRGRRPTSASTGFENNHTYGGRFMTGKTVLVRTPTLVS